MCFLVLIVRGIRVKVFLIVRGWVLGCLVELFGIWEHGARVVDHRLAKSL